MPIPAFKRNHKNKSADKKNKYLEHYKKWYFVPKIVQVH